MSGPPAQDNWQRHRHWIVLRDNRTRETKFEMFASPAGFSRMTCHFPFQGLSILRVHCGGLSHFANLLGHAQRGMPALNINGGRYVGRPAEWSWRGLSASRRLRIAWMQSQRRHRPGVPSRQESSVLCRAPHGHVPLAGLLVAPLHRLADDCRLR